jgi:hypothetical protein
MSDTFLSSVERNGRPVWGTTWAWYDVAGLWMSSTPILTIWQLLFKFNFPILCIHWIAWGKDARYHALPIRESIIMYLHTVYLFARDSRHFGRGFAQESCSRTPACAVWVSARVRCQAHPMQIRHESAHQTSFCIMSWHKFANSSGGFVIMVM